MEAIVPAFLLALLTQIGDRPALLAAVLADRHAAPLRIALGAGLGHAVVSGVAAGGGALVAPMLTPEARALLLAFALVSAGLSGFWPIRTPDKRERWRIGGFTTALVATTALSLGERGPFLTFAIAAGGMPWLAAIGATLGASAAAFVAAVLGEAGWTALPLRRARIAIGLLLLAAGAYAALTAFRIM